MSNKYFLKINSINQNSELSIDQERFKQLQTSRSVLLHALAIEETYEIIISNFLELEREAVNISISNIYRSHVECKNFFGIRLNLNIRLINLLTSARLYRDQLLSHICACIPDKVSTKDEVKKEVATLFSTEYNSSFEYRFMEALRNYVQHEGLPVHFLSMNSKWTGLDDGLLEYSLSFSTQKKLLLDSSFKKLVLEEMPDKVNLSLATRIYIEAISHIHNQAREKIKETVNESRCYLDQAIDDYRAIYKGEPIGLCAYEYKGEEKTDEVLVLTEWDDIRQELVEKNGELVNLRKRYVSSQAHNK